MLLKTLHICVSPSYLNENLTATAHGSLKLKLQRAAIAARTVACEHGRVAHGDGAVGDSEHGDGQTPLDVVDIAATKEHRAAVHSPTDKQRGSRRTRRCAMVLVHTCKLNHTVADFARELHANGA